MRLQNYLEDMDDYKRWIKYLDSLTTQIVAESAFDTGLQKSIEKISSDIEVPKDRLIDALKSKSIFKILSAVGFSVKKLFDLLVHSVRLIKNGVIDAIKDLYDSGKVDQLKKGTIKIDEILKDHPILKQLTGPVIGGVLFLIWMKAAFIGDPEEDFNMSYIVDAIKGKYSLYDLFVSPQGIFDLLLVAVGSVFSFDWLLATEIEGLIVALIYTTLRRSDPLKGVIKKVIPIT